MKRFFAGILVLALLLTACAAGEQVPESSAESLPAPSESSGHTEAQIVDILLADDGVICGAEAVYTAQDIIYYAAGQDESYGSGSEADAHTAEEAAAHTVVHITAPGTYRLTGTLSAGQIFVDLGEGAESDPSAVVTLLLDNASITCSVAPAILFYRVYECGGDSKDFVREPDLRGAGAVVELADDSRNLVSGAYVAKIYQPGTEKKLHKYDGAFYSRQSMRIEGNTGSLNIVGTNEGLCTERHLELNGGNLIIAAADDGINVNEDGLSVVTINGGELRVRGGTGAEGDGIDSNGALVINGGVVYAGGNDRTGDGGIDADVGIWINGGLVVAGGSRNDTVEADSAQQFMELSLLQTLAAGSLVELSANGETCFSVTLPWSCNSLTLSSPALELDVVYTLTVDGEQQQYGGATQSRPGFGEINPPPDVEIPPQPTEPVLPAGVQEPPAQPQGGEQPPQSGAVEPPADGALRPAAPGEGEITLPGFPVNQTVSTEFVLTVECHSFSNVCRAGTLVRLPTS